MKKQHLDVGGLFVAIGHEPNTKLFKNQIKLDDEGYVSPKKQNTYKYRREFLQQEMSMIEIIDKQLQLQDLDVWQQLMSTNILQKVQINKNEKCAM